MTSLILGIAIIAAAIAVSVGGMVVFRRFLKADALKLDHDVTSALIAVLGTLYAIVLGLVVVDALAHREQAEMMEGNEANALATVMHMCRSLPVETRNEIYKAELDYLDSVIDVEWPMMAVETTPHNPTVESFGVLWEKVSGFEPQTNKETNLHAAMLTAMSDFSNARRFRIVASKHGLPPLLWLILILGGICTIGFTYFFGAERIKLQAVMTSVVAFVLCLNVLLVYFYGSPYRGDLAIKPSTLEHVRDTLRKAPALHYQPPQAKAPPAPPSP